MATGLVGPPRQRGGSHLITGIQDGVSHRPTGSLQLSIIVGNSSSATAFRSRDQHYIGVVGRMRKPVITPEAYNGEGSFTDWLDHFESVATLNKWKDDDKVLWL